MAGPYGGWLSGQKQLIMIISFSGRIGSGKDTAAQIVQELYPEMNWQIKGVADKLRHVAHIFTGIPPLNMTDQDVKNQSLGDEWGGITLRTFLQRLGTDAIRDNLDESAWVNALMVDYKPFESYSTGQIVSNISLLEPNWLITDCRFPNEVEAVKNRGGTCFRIIRPDNPYPQSTHESETAIDHIEMPTIINDGNLEQLKLRIREAVEPIIKNLGK